MPFAPVHKTLKRHKQILSICIASVPIALVARGGPGAMVMAMDRGHMPIISHLFIVGWSRIWITCKETFGLNPRLILTHPVEQLSLGDATLHYSHHQ